MKTDITTCPGAPAPGSRKVCLNVGILIVDSKTVHKPGSLVFEQGQIVATGSAEVGRLHQDAVIWEAPDFICAPGLINAHTHVALAYLRGLGHGQVEMIEKLFFATESKLDASLLEPLSYSYIMDGLRSGVTCFGDHYYFIEGVAKALVRLGVRGAVGETIQDLGGPFAGSRWHSARDAIESWAYGPLVQPVVAPHASDTLSGSHLKELADYAKSRSLPLHMHLSQTDGERRRTLAREGQSPVAFAEACGALGEHTLAVHLVATDGDDWRRIHGSGTTVGLCPGSQIIYERLAPLEGLLDKATPAALANDCAASNDSADLLAEARLLALLAKHEGITLAPQRLFDMMTTAGANVFGLNCGSLHAGQNADFFLVKNDITLQPMHDVLTHLIYSGATRNVMHVMVDGKWVLWNREPQLASELELRNEFLAAVKEIHRRVGGPHAGL